MQIFINLKLIKFCPVAASEGFLGSPHVSIELAGSQFSFQMPKSRESPGIALFDCADNPVTVTLASNSNFCVAFSMVKVAQSGLGL